MRVKSNLLYVLFFGFGLAQWSELNGQSAGGQNLTFSPYSNFGIGEWMGVNYPQNGANQHTRSGMYSYTLQNPATLGNLYFTTFNVGGSFKAAKIRSSNQSLTYQGGGLNYFSLAFRTFDHYKRQYSYDSVRKQKTVKSTRYGINSCISLQPITSVGYQYIVDDTVPFKTRTTHSGYGGVNLLELSNSFRLGSHLSLGYSGGFLFGQLNDQSVFSTPDSGQLNIVEDLKSVLIRGYQQKIGFMTQYKLDSTYHTFGGSLQTFGNVLGTQSRLTRTMEVIGSGVYVVDTVLNLHSHKTQLDLPISFGFGYNFQYRQSWALSLDYRQQNWTGLKGLFFDAGRTYTNRKDYGVTLIIHPNDFKMPSSRHMKTPFRLGAVFSETQYIFDGSTPASKHQLVQQKIFAGFGIPITRRYYDNSALTSVIHVQVDYVRRGTTAFGLAQEQFLNLTLGLQLGDIWFQRRKFD